MIRQGDILIVPVETAVPIKGRRYRKIDAELGHVVAEGEATGHHHKVKDDGVKLFDQKGELYLKVPKGGAKLEHDEHSTLVIPQGTHRVVRQREYVGPAVRTQAPRTRRVWD